MQLGAQREGVWEVPPTKSAHDAGEFLRDALFNAARCSKEPANLLTEFGHMRIYRLPWAFSHASRILIAQLPNPL